ncbi:MAG: hypothetical protein H0X40_14710 [Chthoniobacterales bacterium]|nr:hypothetical protein [Chthoniobacterales bacterium]
MKFFLSALVTAGSVFLVTHSAFSQAPALDGGGIWSDVNEQAMTATRTPARQTASLRNITPLVYRTLSLNRPSLEQLLNTTTPEFSSPMSVGGRELQLPMPNGDYARFLIQQSSIMQPKFAARHPELKTYVGQGIDDPTATIRVDLTPRGFHAQILSTNGDVFIDPYWRDSDANYVSYFKRDFAAADKPFNCLVGENGEQTAAPSRATLDKPTGANLRSYRLALACTGEYSAYVSAPNSPNVADTLAAIITSINRCSGVYEREFAIRFVLVDDEEKIVFTDSATDPYTNSNAGLLLSQNQTTCDNVIGSANYDFGHVFSTGGGGLSSLGVVCRNGSKASSETGLFAPKGDPFDIDYVVHEMGHQFGANHPFNATSGSCAGGNRNASTAYEIGSGTTIMAYAGICAPQDLAPHSDDYFYTINYDEVDTYTGTGTGSTCPTVTPTGNTPPTIAALTAYTIPSQTPFYLTASASDPDGDILTYCWEEFDKGPAQDPTKDPRDNGSSPIFRSFLPTTNPTRLFPSLSYILNNQNVPPATIAPDVISGEFLPTTSRTMTYRVTVRDNHAGGGGSNYVSTTVTSVSTAGPFAITAPNNAATIAAGSQQTVTWNVAGSNAAPFNAANVKITLSTDGGQTFPIVLAASVPNSGTAIVIIPNTANVATTQGRIEVEAVGNIFFDISDANLTITSTNNAPPTLNVTGSVTVMRGTPTATVATIGTAADPDGGALTVAVSNAPFGAHLTPSISGGSISISALVDCPLVTTLTSRTYPVTITVTDSKGSTVSGTFSLLVQPNPSPTLGTYTDVNVTVGRKARSTPSAPAADPNNNLEANPYSIEPATLPGGGTITINQHSGVVSVRTASTTTAGTVPVRVTVLDTCGAAAVEFFNVVVTARTQP